ncbi:MAG: hypothetical protein AAF578_00020 [Pseudomonadota bacterium]
MTTPFRWNIKKREQLGSLIEDFTHDRFEVALIDDLRVAASRVVAQADNAALAFIGRTPENFFDYLSGVFDGLTRAPDLHLVQFSLRYAGKSGLESLGNAKLEGFFDYLGAEGLSPDSIATSRCPIALIDFVAEGGTMENLVRLLKLNAERDGVDWNAVQRRLRIIGLRVRTKNSPNTWRWEQHQDWFDLIPDVKISNVSMPREYISHLANYQNKVTDAFRPEYWDRFSAKRANPSSDAQRQALGFALHLYDLGRSRHERQRLAESMAGLPQMRQAATRALVVELNR